MSNTGSVNGRYEARSEFLSPNPSPDPNRLTVISSAELLSTETAILVHMSSQPMVALVCGNGCFENTGSQHRLSTTHNTRIGDSIARATAAVYLRLSYAVLLSEAKHKYSSDQFLGSNFSKVFKLSSQLVLISRDIDSYYIKDLLDSASHPSPCGVCDWTQLQATVQNCAKLPSLPSLPSREIFIHQKLFSLISCDKNFD